METQNDSIQQVNFPINYKINDKFQQNEEHIYKYIFIKLVHSQYSLVFYQHCHSSFFLTKICEHKSFLFSLYICYFRGFVHHEKP